MPPPTSALLASSYQHPNPDGLFRPLRLTIIQEMVERGFEYATMAEHAISWAEDQDPFGHVMVQTYMQIFARCFNRLLESFQEQLKDEFHDFMRPQGIGPMTNNLTLNMKRVIKYPDLLITGFRILKVERDRIFIKSSTWSVAQKASAADLENWVVFFDHDKGKRVDLIEQGGVYNDLYLSLKKRAAESQSVFETWEEKQKINRKGTKL